MRIGLLTRTNNPRLDRPVHYLSAAVAAALCAERISLGWSVGGTEQFKFAAVPISKHLIQLQTDESIASIRRRYRCSTPVIKAIPQLLPPIPPSNLDIAYPRAGQETVRHPHYAFRTACELARKQCGR